MRKKVTTYDLQPKTCSRGSAMVAVLVILAIALLATTALVQNVLVDSNMSFNLKKSDETYNNAISSTEEAILRLLRDPSFSGTTLSFSDGNAIINIIDMPNSQKQINIISRVHDDKYICQIQALVVYDIEGNLSIREIREIY